ncbi:hypothetical protein FHR83_008465 [Actinoplanes campanulatus]|uniref:HEAT repeat-containing protein n=1 Tax=Actinoplanes campanulatus TaxID=113559 RepID=A0A7W5AR02_9ACTN|nr:HEAT repeat domain-containing protein [Actinoplanes campanulatus]MBB3100740.1 hypothetical protein [Actinoplanes campanulatus]GGN46090.1 hypothetical protein GCM10010109_80940 [Actinoplanes campanulatus]GID41198.1 hypothetical protein Aca09nite_77040 [Actinoplanes campanulatus]
MQDRLVYPAGPAVGEGSALLRAAAAAGHGTRVRELLENGWSDSARNDTELMLWAADYGAYQVIQDRLEENTTKPMLRIARSWVGVDPMTELRRRLGDAGAVVQRETVPVDAYDHTASIRATAADGRWAQMQMAHVAIVTYVEEHLGIGASLDELMARALMDRDPNSVNWTQSWHTASSRPDVEATARWATAVLLAPDLHARLYAAELLHALAIGPAPCREEILCVLRIRLTAESDVSVLASLIATDLLAKLATDCDGRVRASAVRVLCTHAFDHPVTRRAITVNRDDPDPHVRPEVLSALARSGDATACAELMRLAGEAAPGSQLAMKAYDAEYWMQRIT